MASELVKTDTGLKMTVILQIMWSYWRILTKRWWLVNQRHMYRFVLAAMAHRFMVKINERTKSPQDFKALTDYAARVIGKAGQHILAGHFPVSPYNLDNKYIPCSYCQYKALCRFENTRNNYRYINK